jgi:hypothetical protein
MTARDQSCRFWQRVSGRTIPAESTGHCEPGSHADRWTANSIPDRRDDVFGSRGAFRTIPNRARVRTLGLVATNALLKSLRTAPKEMTLLETGERLPEFSATDKANSLGGSLEFVAVNL